MTAAVGTCAARGVPGMLGRAPVYRGAGTVLRCPHCGAVMPGIDENGGIPGVDAQRLAELRWTTAQAGATDGDCARRLREAACRVP